MYLHYSEAYIVCHYTWCIVAVHEKAREEERKCMKTWREETSIIILICWSHHNLFLSIWSVWACVFPFSCFSLLTDKTVSECKHNLLFAATVSSSYHSRLWEIQTSTRERQWLLLVVPPQMEYILSSVHTHSHTSYGIYDQGCLDEFQKLQMLKNDLQSICLIHSICIRESKELRLKTPLNVDNRPVTLVRLKPCYDISMLNLQLVSAAPKWTKYQLLQIKGESWLDTKHGFVVGYSCEFDHWSVFAVRI